MRPRGGSAAPGGQPGRGASAAQACRIVVAGTLDPSWGEWLGGLEVVAGDSPGTCALVGLLADQSALHGVLARIRDLGLTLLSVVAGPSPGPLRVARNGP